MTLVVFAFPILTVTLALLALDRTIGTHFFTAGGGGNAMMYVNLIWAWGHPEVYILVLPAFGVYSEIVATFSRKKLFGYTTMVWALVGHRDTVLHRLAASLLHDGRGSDVNAFFGIMTAVIAVPTGVKIFNWLFTMYRGRIHFATPMYLVHGFCGDIHNRRRGWRHDERAGYRLPSAQQPIPGCALPYDDRRRRGVRLFCGITYWFPKIFGFRLNETFGKICFLVLGRRLPHGVRTAVHPGLDGRDAAARYYSAELRLAAVIYRCGLRRGTYWHWGWFPDLAARSECLAA